MFFSLDRIPPSTNQSLTIANGRLIHSQQARDFRKTSELAFKNQIEQNIRINPMLQTELKSWSNEPLAIHIMLHSDWMTQKATIRKTDAANREKLLCDSLFSAYKSLGYTLDDSQLYLIIITKNELKAGDNEKTSIQINKLVNFRIT